MQLLLLGVALVAASFYAGTLFGSSASPALVLPPSRPLSPDSSRAKGAYRHFSPRVCRHRDPPSDSISQSTSSGLLRKTCLWFLAVVEICVPDSGLWFAGIV